MVRKGLTNEKIVAAALEIVETKGYANFSLHTLAESLNIKTASLYNHITSMDELFVDMEIMTIQIMKNELDKAINGYERDEALLRLADAMRAFMQKHHELCSLMMDVSACKNERLMKKFPVMEDPFSLVLDAYGLTREQKIHWERILQSTLYGFMSFEQKGLFEFSASLSETYRQALQSIIASLESLERVNKLNKMKL